MRILDMKKKLTDPSSCSSLHVSVVGNDEDCFVPAGSVNKAKVMELLGATRPQEYLEISDLLGRTHHVEGSPSQAHSNDDGGFDEDRSNDNIDKARAFPLPFHPTDQKPSNTPVALPASNVAYVQSQHSPLMKAAFVQELAASHWPSKLLKFQGVEGMSLTLDIANQPAKSSQLQLGNVKGAKPTNSPNQDGTFPLPLPCSKKHLLPRPQNIQASPVAHPLPPPLSRTTLNEHTASPRSDENDRVDIVSRQTVSCSLSANELSTQDATALPSPMEKLDKLARAPHLSSLDAAGPQLNVSAPNKTPSLPLSARQSPRPSLPGSPWLLPNSPLRSPGRKMLCPRKWRKGAILGQGTFGVVHEGLNLEDGSFFAIKVSSWADVSPEIQQEVDLLSKLEHPNIVRYLGSAIEDGRPCIFIELVRMGSLEAILRKYKRFADNTIRSYTRQILLGLEYLHSKKTMHRDIKCANILVDVNGRVKLSDFGVAKEVDDTLALSLKGTPLYMAPEVLTPNKNRYSFSADIWSLGCTVFEMADGKPPWSNLHGFAFLFKVKKGELPPIPEHLSPEGKDFIRRCLKLHAKDRPTAQELLQHPFVINACTPDAMIPRAPPSPVPNKLSLASQSSSECQDSHPSSPSIQCTL